MKRRQMDIVEQVVAVRQLQRHRAQCEAASARQARQQADAAHADALDCRQDQAKAWEDLLGGGRFNLDIAHGWRDAVQKQDVELAWLSRRLREAERIEEERLWALKAANARLDASEKVQVFVRRQSHRAQEERRLGALTDHLAERLHRED